MWKWMQECSTCPYCEKELSSAIVVADTALVGLVLEMKVFRGESAEHAGRIAKSVIGKALRDVPLKVTGCAGTMIHIVGHTAIDHISKVAHLPGEELLDPYHGPADLLWRRGGKYCCRDRNAWRAR